jgi:uncharacterized protein (TIGR01777 family)
VEIVEGNPLRAGPWWQRLAECDAAINLVGEPIQGRWSEHKKTLIRNSRLITLTNLTNAIPAAKSFTLISVSAVGVYGDGKERALDESAPLGGDFLATVARDWERAAERARTKGIRVVTTRLGLVLGPGGGVLEQMSKAMRSVMGCIVGSGRQWVSWIHQEDLARAMLFLMAHPELQGTVNLSSPNPVRQGDFARSLGALLNRPVGFPAPAFSIRLAFGEFADVLLFSQRMVPKVLLEAGFSFRFSELNAALRDSIGQLDSVVRHE